MSSKLNGKTVREIRSLAREDAENILTTHWPNRELPIDPIVIARRFGITVYDAQLGENVWGMIVGEDGETSIYLDVDQNPSRYRFTCAHELGHYVDRREELMHGGALVDYRDNRKVGTADEIYANEFAASLLMPESEFRWHFESGANDFALAMTFDVSVDAATLRRKHLGLTRGS